MEKDLETKLKELYDKSQLNEKGHKVMHYSELIPIWFNVGHSETARMVNSAGLTKDNTFTWVTTVPFSPQKVFDHLVICHPEFFVDYDEARACAGNFIEKMEDLNIFVSGVIKGTYRNRLVKSVIECVKDTPEGEIANTVSDLARGIHNNVLELATDTFAKLKRYCKPSWKETLASIKDDETICKIFDDSSVDIEYMWVYFLMFIYGGMNLESDLSSVELHIKRALRESNFITLEKIKQ